MADRIRVLHVEDESGFANLTASNLEHEDDRMVVESVTTVAEALDRLEEGVDCVVCDYDLAGEDGIDLLETVRETHPDLPFILFTGQGSEAVAAEAISVGATDYLQKTGNIDQFTILANRIRNAVSRVEHERQLQQEHERLRALFENFPEPTFAYGYDDGKPVIRAVNEAFEEIFGFDAEEAVGSPVDDLIVPPERIDEAADIDRRVEEGERVDAEVRRRTTDGEGSFNFRNIDVPTDGDISGYAVYTDITEHRERERELRATNERLEEFASIVSHDLRSPLSVAEGRLELAREECDSEHLDAVARSHDRMATLVDDMLALARRGTDLVEISPVAVAEVVEQSRETVDLAGATVVCETDAVVEADPGRLQQLFENLFRNARDHASTDGAADGSDEGGRSVTITVGALEDGFYVADDGPGIPPESRDAVFESGYTTFSDGTGLGLAIVREIVEAHGWSIAAVEGTDGGARFEVTGVTFAE